MAGTGPAVVQDAPPLSPPANGLLAAAPVMELTDYRWGNGIQIAPEACTDAQVFDPCSIVSAGIVTSVTDGATTNGSATVTSASAAFTVYDTGRSITGTGIPTGALILAVVNATTVTLTVNATATATGVTLTMPSRLASRTRGTVLNFQPFVVDAHDICSTFGFQTSDYEGRARRALAATESKAVEKEFWTGTLTAANRHLADDTLTTKLAGGSALGLVSSLAALVQAAADYNMGRGMIHARPTLVTRWSALNLLRWEGGKLYTLTGVQVVPGSGYPGTSPAAAAATFNSEWAYVTQPVVVERGPVEVLPNANDTSLMVRNTNVVVVRAQRLYSVVFNACAVAGVHVDTSSNS